MADRDEDLIAMVHPLQETSLLLKHDAGFNSESGFYFIANLIDELKFFANLFEM